MDKLILQGKDLNRIIIWAEENMDILPPCPPLALSELKIQFKDVVDSEGITTSFSYTVKNISELKFRFKIYDNVGKCVAEFKTRYYDGQYKDDERKKMESIQKMLDFVSEGESTSSTLNTISKSDFQVMDEDYYRESIFGREQAMSLISMYFYISCFFVYYKPKVITRESKLAIEKTNNYKPKTHKSINKKNKDHVIIFKEYINEVDSGKRKNSHTRSPFTCAFGVRGHYRQYKNGKRVWVKEYVKGTGTKISKTYKLEVKK